MKNNNLRKIFGFIVICAMLMALVTSCLDRDFSGKEYVESDKVVTDYLETDKDTANKCAIFLSVLKRTGYDKILGTYGTFTVFAPTDLAMKSFLADNGKDSIGQFTNDFLVKFVRGHVMDVSYSIFKFKIGSLSDTTMLGNNLFVSYTKDGLNVLVNQKSKIIAGDLLCSNGFIHKIDQVIIPVTQNIYDYLFSHDEYSFLREAIVKTGYDSILKLGSYWRFDGLYKSRVERLYTLFAETDSVFKARGINSYADLYNKYCQTGNPKDPFDSLNIFIGYHILTKRVYSDVFTSGNYTTAALADIQMTIHTDDSVRISPEPLDTIKITKIKDGVSYDSTVIRYRYTTIIPDVSNINLINGVIHRTNRILKPSTTLPEDELIPVFDTWMKPYIDSLHSGTTNTWQGGNGQRMKIFQRDTALKYFKGIISWKIYYQGTVQYDGINVVQSDGQDICYSPQASGAGNWIGSILSGNPAGDGKGNCLFIEKLNQWEITWYTRKLTPGTYKVGVGYKQYYNRGYVKVIVDDDPLLLDANASIIDMQAVHANYTGTALVAGQTTMLGYPNKRDGKTDQMYTEVQVGSVTFDRPKIHRIKLTNMPLYGVNYISDRTFLIDYIRLEAVK
jgi:uncharacterized surface protein with fasciclin (FAS1) repeats